MFIPDGKRHAVCLNSFLWLDWNELEWLNDGCFCATFKICPVYSSEHYITSGLYMSWNESLNISAAVDVNGFPLESDLAVFCRAVGEGIVISASFLHFLLPVWTVALQSEGIPLSNAENKTLRRCVCACVFVFSYVWAPQKSPTDSLPYFFCASILIWPTLLQLHACVPVCVCSANALLVNECNVWEHCMYVLQLCCNDNHVFCSACGFTHCLYKVLTALDIFSFL